MDPIPLIPPVAPPLTPPLTPVGDQRPGTGRFARRLAQRRSAAHPDDEDEDLEYHDLPPSRLRTDPAQPLLEALDRLRVTHEMRPAELEYANAQRAMRAYQDPTTQIHRVKENILQELVAEPLPTDAVVPEPTPVPVPQEPAQAG